MKDFNTYFNDQGKGQDMNNAEDLVKQMAGAFEGKGEADILRAIYKEAERGRKAGTLTDAELDKELSAFRCLVWVSGSGGGGAGRVVWGYGYHVVVHRRPATA